MYYTICTTAAGRDPFIPKVPTALLFDSPGPAMGRFISLAPEIHNLFSTGYFVTLAQEMPGSLVHGTLVCDYKALVLPDVVELNPPPLWYCYTEHAWLLNLHQHYGRCLSFFKTVHLSTTVHQ